MQEGSLPSNTAQKEVTLLLLLDYIESVSNSAWLSCSPPGCMAAGFLPLVVTLGALGLIFFQWLQLRKLDLHLSNPEVSSDEYRAEARVTFWKMVRICQGEWVLKIILPTQIWVHCGLGGLVLVIAFILTAGYGITCRNMWGSHLELLYNDHSAAGPW